MKIFQWIFATVLGLACIKEITGSKAEFGLIQKLMSDYDRDVRPVETPGGSLPVFFDISLHQVMDLDERNQIFTGSIWLRYKWHDSSLVWKPSEHQNLTEVHLAAERIWRPDINLYTDVNIARRDIESLYAASISHDGTVKWYAPAILSSTCTLDVTYFPWDTQICDLEFGSWNYDGLDVDLQNSSDSGAMENFMEDGEWILKGIPVKRRLNVFVGRPYPTLVYSVHIERKPMYYVINIILPCIYITLCGLLVFLLPPDSGEKVSLAVTILLASTVFLLIVAEAMPPQSSVVPLIGRYFIAAITILVLCTMVTVLILHGQFNGSLKRPVPGWMQKVVFHGLARCLFLHKTVMDNLGKKNIYVSSYSNADLKNCPEKISLNKTYPNSKSDAQVPYGKNSEADHEEICKKQWMLVVLVLDRFFFIVFLLIIIFVSVAMIGGHP